MSKEECLALVDELRASVPHDSNHPPEIKTWLGRLWHVYAILRNTTSLDPEPLWIIYYLWRLWEVADEPGKGIVDEDVQKHIVIFGNPMEDWQCHQLDIILGLQWLRKQIETTYTLTSVAERIGYEGAETLDAPIITQSQKALLEGHGLRIWPSRSEIECAGIKKILSNRNWGIVSRCIADESWSVECDFLLGPGQTVDDVDLILKDLNAPWENQGCRILRRRGRRIILGSVERRKSPRRSPEQSPKEPRNTPVIAQK